MKKPDLQRLVPPGVNAQQELHWICGGWALSLLYSLGFVTGYSQERNNLYMTVTTSAGRQRVLRSGAVMPDFADLLGTHLYGFLLVALCVLAVVVYHYLYHRQGSKSIYLMRRLPDGMELHRRCWTLPVLGALASILLAFVLLMIYYAVYILVTPKSCLPPDQWQKLWSVIL